VSLKSLQEKCLYLTPILFVLFVFFIPISPSLKSIFFALAVASVLFNPTNTKYLFYAFNTYWGRIAVFFVAFIALACCWSPAPFSLQMSVLSKYSKLLYLPILAVGFINPKTRLWCVNAYLLSMIVTFFTALLKLYGFVEVGLVGDVGTLFYNHIITGFMMAIACYLAAVYAYQSNGLRRAAYLLVFLITSSHVLFINTGRTGYIIYFVLMGLFLLQKLSLKKALLAFSVFTALFCLAYSCSTVMQNGVHGAISDIKFFQKNNPNTSLGYRVQFHDYAQSLLMKNPVFGVGTGGFQYSFSQEQPIPAWGPILNDPHSQYWMTLSEQGIIGLSILVLFLGSLFFAAFQLKENGAMLLGVLIAFCLSAFSDSILCYSTAGYLLIVISALCFGEYIQRYAVENKKQIQQGSSFKIEEINLAR
jgi:O-antigen ligase